MLTTVIIASLISILVSAFCSLSEAALYAIPISTVKVLAQKKSLGTTSLEYLKKNMARLIAAILMINTIANTLGAAFAGAQVGSIMGKSGVIIFSVIFTIALLFIGEIIPKTFGIAYSRNISVGVAPIWYGLVHILRPFVWFGEYLSKGIAPLRAHRISQEEIASLARLGTEDGALDRFEGAVISNVMKLDDTLVRDVLTPRVSLFMLSEETLVGELKEDVFKWKHTRVPIFSPNDPDHLTGYVMHRDIIKLLFQSDAKAKLKTIARPINTFPEFTTIDRILSHFFNNNEQLCAIVDEHGSLAGIVTLEDILEELVGTEIEDELDVKDRSV